MATNAATLSMPAGTYIDIEAPVDTDYGFGYFIPTTTNVKLHGDSVPHTLGFVSEDTDVGTLAEVDSKSVKVRYTQVLNKENRIWYFTGTGEVYVINIIAIPIHNHSSILQGGPAYGTYAYDSTTEEDDS